MIRSLALFALLSATPLIAAPPLPAEDQRRLDAVDWGAVREEAAALLSGFVRVPSDTGHETAAAAYLEKAAAGRGLAAERWDSAAGRAAVWAATASGAPRVVLLSHLDTVPASPDGWTHPPLSGARANGYVWGRGAVDAKGQAIAHLMALAVLRRIDPAYPRAVALLCVADEEGHNAGAATAVKERRDRLGDALVLGEGGAPLDGLPMLPAGITAYPIATAEKSNLWVRLTLDLHSSAHGSVPPAEYANRQMVIALNRLMTRPFAMRLTDPVKGLLTALARHENFPRNLFMRNPGWPVINRVLERQLAAEPFTNALVRDTATLTGLEVLSPAPNVLVTRCVATLDCRLLPGTGEGAFLAALAKTLAEPRIRIEVTHRSPSSPGTPAPELMQALTHAIEAGDPEAMVSPFLFPASSDANYFRAAGMQVLGFFPCRLSRKEVDAIHGVDERMPEASLERGVRVLVETLLRLKGAPASD